MRSLFKVHLCLPAVLVCLLAACPAGALAATLSVTPGTVSCLYTGDIALQISGLTNGETVLVERFLDVNGNGVIDTGEPLVQSFKVTDGQVTAVAGVRNRNVPGDGDLLANGQIAASLHFASGPEFSCASSSQIFRVSSPTARFTPVQQIMTVTQGSYPQQITGTVMSGGTPLPFSTVAVLVQVGTDNIFAAGTAADASGNFSLAVSNGTYLVIAFLPGYVGNFGTSPSLTVSGANTNVTVPLSAASFTLSGSATDTSTGASVPGIQFFATTGNNDFTAFFTDAQGNFSAGVTNGQWKLEPSDNSTGLSGHMAPQNKVRATVSGANVSGVNVPLTPGRSLIYGTLQDALSRPLAGVRVDANDGGNLYRCSALTDASGNFFLAVTNGTWNIGVFSQSSGLPAGYIVQGVQVGLGDGQAIQTNLVAQLATAHLIGRATDSNGTPIGSGSINAFISGGAQNVNAQLAGDGSFDIPLWGGTWTISLESGTAASHNVVGPELVFSVTDGASISNISYVAQISTRTISGWVRNSTNAGVSGLNVFAGAQINGTNYNASATTDATGNYTLKVTASIWNVGVDTQGLAQRGYGPAMSQTSDTTSGSQVVNFTLSLPPVGRLTFRHMLGVVGEFGGSLTPTVTYPVGYRNYRALFMVFNDTNPPTADTVLFTGPPGSGLTNSPGDTSFGAVQDGTNVYYFSQPVRNPSSALGGTYSVMYRGNANVLNVPDPQANARLLVPVPTITLSNDVLWSVHWNYKDANGNPITGTPAFVLTNRIDLIDQNGNLFDAELFPAATSYTYPAANSQSWLGVGILRVNYYDDLTNQFFVAFSQSSPSLSGFSRPSGSQSQLVLNAVPGVNYTIQVSTNLALPGWSTLLVTNFLQSPVTIVDPAATTPSRFYRVLIGP